MLIQTPGRGLWSARPARRGEQFSTHLGLLANTTARVEASLDAIVVPASRPAVNLDHAITLARKLSCQLVVLCSLNARASEVNELLALRNFTRAIVVDLPDGYVLPKLDLATSTPTGLGLPGRFVNPNGDLSVKRNIGLLLARMMRWRRIFFLDDDIRDLYSSDLREVAMMLGPCDAVGMRATDFPDNSVVCHGNRKTGGDQDIFVSGSVLAVHCTDAVPFFPEIYNEDWFFFYHAAAARRLGRYGRDATQLCYDPFADPQRAAGQEFGDIMAEGLYGLLHQRAGLDSATGDFWQSFLDTRMRFLAGVQARANQVDQYLGRRIAGSVDAAMAWCDVIKPSMCERYIRLWRQDLITWEHHLEATPVGLSAKAALGLLDLAPAAPSLYQLSGVIGGGQSRVTGSPARMAMLASSGAGPSGRSVIGHTSGRGEKLAHRVLLALAKEPGSGVGVSRIRRSGQLVTGRHRSRKMFIPPVRIASLIPSAWPGRSFLIRRPGE